MPQLVARRESFGGIIGKSDGYGFRVVNHAGFDLLRKLSSMTVEQVVSSYEPDLRASVDVFISGLASRGWIGTGSGLHCRFLDNGNEVSHLSAPIRVWLEVTSRCNLSCAQCFNQNHPDYLTPDLPFDSIRRIIDALHEAAVIQVTVTGGEPLVRKDIYSILDLLVEREFGIRFFTNGTVLSESNASRLSSYPISHLFLSLDGAGEDNDLLRGAGTFSRIAKGLSILSGRNQNITLSTTLHRLSHDRIGALFALAKEHGVRSILIRPLFEYRPGKIPMSIPPADLDRLLEALELASCTYGVEYQLNKLPFRPLKKSTYVYDDPHDVHFSYFSQHNSFGCVGGNTVVGIKANGVIMACGFLPHEYQTVGNSVLETSFLDLWNRSGNVTILRDLAGNAVCKTCTLLPLCGGGCRANSLLQIGDINGVDPYCYWRNRGPAELRPTREPRQYADGREPYLSGRAIITKCGAGSDL